jgi:uncharacterized protein (TIGR03118 family)
MRVARLDGKNLPALVVTVMAFVVCLSSLANAAGYKAKMLVADQTGVAANTDPHLINPWGISLSPTGPFWVSDNGTGLSTLYNTTGVPQSLVVTIPPVAGGTVGVPTGTVFNGTTDFSVTKGTKSGPAPFLFVGEDGSISGWNPTVDPTNAILVVDNSASQSDYKGMELGNNGTANFLYVPNFFAATVEVFDGTFQKVNLSGSFTDTHLPAGFAPFNIRLINGQLFVAFAKQNAVKHDARTGPGLGIVDIFDLNGNFVKRLVSKGKLNAPWGMALAPATFGTFSNNLLVGNLGDGLINAYDITTGAFKGQLATPAGQPIVLKGLWGLNFGNGGTGGTANVLYFTSGPSGYQHGRFGSITAQ